MSDTPAYIDYDMKTEQLSDETGMVQTGVSTDTVYYTYNKDWDA